MEKRNKDIREYAKKKGVNLYQVAQEIGVSEWTFVRKLRNEMSKEEQIKILNIIDKIAKKEGK